MDFFPTISRVAVLRRTIAAQKRLLEGTLRERADQQNETD